MNLIPEVNISNSDIQRAHRVGRENGRNPRQMIVKLKAWNTRAIIYKGRKKLRDHKIFVDLTKRRFGLKTLAAQKVAENDIAEYSFADINCSLGLKLANGEYKYFNSEEELNLLLGGN